MTRIVARLCLALILAAFAKAAVAEEVITAFHQDITLEQTGAMAVTETIKVNSEGHDIRHGIFRDFPLTFTDSAGRLATVDFTLQSVERDGVTDQSHTERIAGGIRIYIGSADVVVDPGPHVYQLTYRTDRQIRYFSDYDELYWNVTGNGWLFRILDASATLTLPSGVKQQGIAYSTGPSGAKGKDARVTETGSEITFETTRPLGRGEGLTINVSLPKTAIAPPSATAERLWFFRDNLDLILAFGGLVIVLAYYARAWVAVGRDPARGVIVPRWDAPDGISPALVNYIDNRGFSGQGWTALSATALDLAVKGYVVLEDLKEKIVVSPTGKAPPAKLEGGEKVLMDTLGRGTPLVIDQANGARVEKVGQSFRSAIESEHRGEYYRSNALYTFGGVLLSVAFLAAIVIFGRLHDDALPLIVVPAFLSVFITILAVSLGKAFRRHGSIASRIMAVVVFCFIGFVAASILAGLVAAVVSTVDMHGELPLMVAIIGIFITNLVFFFLMGAPTAIGTRMMDGIDGLRQYLTLAEQDRMNMQGAPSMSPRHFETLLPYAVALGVEKPWSRTFETWLAAAAAGAAAGAYAPGWYIGAFNGGSFSDRIGGFSASMASTIASTIPAPVSSSSSGFSGGGSSSGGGGGGGGGGGW